MPARKPPTIDEVIAAVEALPGANDRALLYYQTMQKLASTLRTTQTRAREWLETACVDDPELRLLWCRGAGLYTVIRRADPDTEYKYKSLVPEALGLPETAIRLSDSGQQVFDIRQATNRELNWIILRPVFERFAAEAQKWNDNDRERREEEAQVEREAWSRKHDYALLLGLYDHIGIMNTSDVRTHVYRDQTSLSLDFRGDDIDKFLDAMRKLGVKPRSKKSR